MFGKKSDTFTTITLDPASGEVADVKVEKKHPLARVLRPRRSKKSLVAEVAPALAVLLAVGGKAKSSMKKEEEVVVGGPNIAAKSGIVTAPVSLLLAIAHGLATGKHWWLMTPSERKVQGFSLPCPKTIEDIKKAHEECVKYDPQFAPSVQFMQGEEIDLIRWVPLANSSHSSPGSRRVSIQIPRDASPNDLGDLDWQTGKTVEKDGCVCSSFIGCILSILPGAVDDGTLANMFQTIDIEDARRIATILAAQKAEIDDDIYSEDGQLIASRMELGRDLDFHLHEGYKPYQAWTYEGVKKSIAHPLSIKELEKLAKSVEPFPWRINPVDVIVR